jgi:rhodanese-related sulfurtransferase
MDDDQAKGRPMAQTFLQMAKEAMARAQSISAEEAIAELEASPNALLVDVRDESEVAVTGIGTQAFNAPGRSIAWLADTDPDNDYRTPGLQDRSRRILTTCGMSPCYRGAKAANLLMKMGFTDVAYVEGGMTALLAAGLKTESPPRPSQAIEIGEAHLPGS